VLARRLLHGFLPQRVAHLINVHRVLHAVRVFHAPLRENGRQRGLALPHLVQTFGRRRRCREQVRPILRAGVGVASCLSERSVCTRSRDPRNRVLCVDGAERLFDA